MKKTFLRGALLLLSLLLLLPFAGCAAVSEKVVATAGDIEILYDEYYYLAMTRLQQLKLEYGEDAASNPEVREKLESFLAENLRTESHALLAIAASLDIDIDSGDIASNVEQHMEGILADPPFSGDRTAYLDSLRAEYLTDRYIRTFVAVENYLSVEVIKVLLQNGMLDDSDATALAFLNGEDVICVRQVVIGEQVINGKTILSAEQARQKAEKLRADVVAAADPVEEMRYAVQNTLDMTDTTGNGIYFARGEMEKNYENAAFALPIYGVSEVFEMENGYCFLMRLPKDEQYIKDNLDELKTKSYYVVLNEMIDAWLAENPLVMTDFGQSLDPMALQSIEPENDDWTLAILLAVLGVVAIAAIFVVRVFLLRARVKAGKPLSTKKKKKAAKK